MEAVSLNSKTIIVKSDNENDISDVIDFIYRRDKENSIDMLLKFASENRVIEKGYVFNRNECYER